MVDAAGVELAGDDEVVEELNAQFSSVFVVENLDSIPHVTGAPEIRGKSPLLDVQVEIDEVRDRLRGLRADKATGVDELSPRLLRELCEELAYPVTRVFRQSMDTGVVPADWRDADVTPIFKKGRREQAENYRPISLTSQLSKILESILKDQIVAHLDKNNLIRESQHGFRKGRSCTTNLLTFLEYVTKHLDGREPVDAVFLDFSKAFDKVPHARLLAKVRAHGIDGKVAEWIAAWLSGRRQQVCVRGRRSGWRRVLSGVPQGSVLGPLLFIIFANDLECGLQSPVLKFADDTNIFRRVVQQRDYMQLQADLDTVWEWARVWQMDFNVAKCKVMHMGTRGVGYDYCMGGRRLEVVDQERDLGVLISNSLKVAGECQQAYAKANEMLGLVARVIRHKDMNLMLRLYKTLVRPHLEYASAAWSPYYVKDKKLLERVQHRFTRMFEKLRDMEYAARLEVLRLWSLEERRNRADLIELFRMARGFSSVPLETFFERSASDRTRGHSCKLLKMRCRGDVRLHFFSLRVVDRWNRLPDSVVRAHANCQCF